MLNNLLDINNLEKEIYRLRKIDDPKRYHFIAPSFIKKYKNPLNFLPYKYVTHFNEKIFYNLIHRECFNSCVNTDNEEICYSNCQLKTLTSIELFKTAIEENFKNDIINSVLNLEEYHKRPEDIGQNIPSDNNYSFKINWIYRNFDNNYNHKTNGLGNIFENK